MSNSRPPVADAMTLDEWQIEQIRQGLMAAEAGDFASDEEVAAAFAEWRNSPLPVGEDGRPAGTDR